MENSLVTEVYIIAREYSQARNSKSKWRLFRKPALSVPTAHIELQATNGEDMLAVIYKEHLKMIDGYLLSNLYKKLVLKRNENVFKAFLSLWNLINPYKLAGISQRIYKIIYEVTYETVFDIDTQDVPIKSMITQDMKIDLGDNDYIGLSDFYDGFFEFIDAFTKSYLAVEYTRLIKSIHGYLLTSKKFNNLNLLSRLHLKDTFKPHYQSWMYPFLKQDEIPYQKSHKTIPSLFKTSLGTLKISERLLKGSNFSKEKTTGDILAKKIEYLINTRKDLKTSNKPRTAGSLVDLRKLSKKRRSSLIELDHLNLVSPLSVNIKRSRRSSSLLEDIIEGRKNYFRRISSQENAGRDITNA